MISSLEYEVRIPLELFLKFLEPFVQEVLRDDHVIGAVIRVYGAQIVAVAVHEVVQVLSNTPSVCPAAVFLHRFLNVHQRTESLCLHANL